MDGAGKEGGVPSLLPASKNEKESSPLTHPYLIGHRVGVPQHRVAEVAGVEGGGGV